MSAREAGLLLNFMWTLRQFGILKTKVTKGEVNGCAISSFRILGRFANFSRIYYVPINEFKAEGDSSVEGNCEFN